MDNNCHIPDLVQVFSFTEHGGFYSYLNPSLVQQSHQIPVNEDFVNDSILGKVF